MFYLQAPWKQPAVAIAENKYTKNTQKNTSIEIIADFSTIFIQ